VQEFRRVKPPSVQVNSHEVAPVVALNNSVWVEERNYFEYEPFPEELGFSAVGLQQELKYALEHEGRIALSRVDSRCQEYYLLS